MPTNKLKTVAFIKLFMILDGPNYISQWQLRIAFPLKERIKNRFALLHGSLFESFGTDYDMQEKCCDFAKETLRI